MRGKTKAFESFSAQGRKVEALVTLSSAACAPTHALTSAIISILLCLSLDKWPTDHRIALMIEGGSLVVRGAKQRHVGAKKDPEDNRASVTRALELSASIFFWQRRPGKY